MNKRQAIAIVLLMMFVLSSLFPVVNGYAATMGNDSLDSALYTAIKSNLEEQKIQATYNDVQHTISISDSEIDKVTTLKLSNSNLTNLKGLERFSKVTSLDLSGNKLTDESDLTVLNSFNLSFLDLSSNQLSDVSSITNIKNIATVNLHNQILDKVEVIENSMVKEGIYKVQCELPQIVREFAKPIKPEWLDFEYEQRSSNDLKFDVSSLTANSDKIGLTIGNNSGNQFTGLAALKININDVTNKLYNSEINVYYVVINENQRAIFLKDKKLYDAVKAQLKQGQSINSDLTEYTSSSNLFDKAYDKQQILVISINDLVNKITSLKLDNKQLSDLSGLEMFVGLEKSLDLHSNYIKTIDTIIDLQEMKNVEEAKLQERFKEKAAQLQERMQTLEMLQNELKTVIEKYNEASEQYNSYNKDENQEAGKTEKLEEIKKVLDAQKKRYKELTGNDIETEVPKVLVTSTYMSTSNSHYVDISYMTSDGISYDIYCKTTSSLTWGTETASVQVGENSTLQVKLEKGERIFEYSIENTELVVGQTITLLPKNSVIISKLGGEIGKAQERIEEKEEELYNLYTEIYKLTSVITPELKNITDEEYENLTLEQAKALLQAQATKMGSVEKHFTVPEKSYLTTKFGIIFDSTDETKTPVATYYTEKLKAFEENPDITSYKTELTKLRDFDAYVMASSSCIITVKIEGVGKRGSHRNYQQITKELDEENVTYITDKLKSEGHDNSETGLTEKLLNYFSRIATSTDEEIKAFVTLPRLYKLNMSENLIENIDDIAVMKELRELYMANNEIANINNINWSEISWLNTLDLSFNNISEIKVLEGLRKLKSINLSKNLIAGKFDFDINSINFDRLNKFDLSSNQIDDIENLKTQFEFKAKEENQPINVYVKNLIKTKGIVLSGQQLSMNLNIQKTSDRVKVELPMIFRQFEEIDGENTTFGIASVYGNAASDGSYVILETPILGTRTAVVTVEGANGIGLGTTCYIRYTVTDGNGNGDNQGNGNVQIIVNTNQGSTVETVKQVDNMSYLVVSKNTKIQEVLKDVTLNTDAYKLVIKDANAENIINSTDTVKTNQTVIVDGLSDNVQCKIVVKGDVTGDGSIGLGDIIKLNQYRLDKSQELTEAEFIAGNIVDTDNEITMGDIIGLNQYRLTNI